MGSSLPKPAFESHICDAKVKRGEDIVFRCEVNTDQLQATWEKNGQRLYEDGRISISKNGKDLSLQIKSAKEQDQGEYTIKLKNDTGSASESASGIVLQFDRDWRTIEWGRNVEIKKSLQDYKPSGQGPKNLRFLLLGDVGSGKSSIINSINSIFQGQVIVGALASNSEGTSFTKFHKAWQIKDKQKGLLPFIFNDIMGLEKGCTEGVHSSDIISALEGHIKDNYKFNPRSPLSKEDPNYNKSPTLDDKVHCLVNVASADSISRLEMEEDDVITKMRLVRERARDLGIPQVVFMTHIDVACQLVKGNLRNTYSSKVIKKKMEVCSTRLGVPMNCIFPIKNYHEEINLDDYVDSFILNALRRIVDFADDYVSRL